MAPLRPRIKQNLNPQRLADGTIHVGGDVYGLAAQIPDEHGLLWTMFALLDGTRDAQSLATDLEMSLEDVIDALDALASMGLLEDAAGDDLHDLRPDQAERHGRSAAFFTLVEPGEPRPRFERQELLARRSVAVIGLGGIGSTVAMSLAATGVGRLHLVDDDVVELSNLNRQLAYTTADVGLPKPDALAARIAALNPDVTVTTESRRVGSAAEIADIVRGHDLFVMGADRPRKLIDHWADDAAYATGVPWVVTMYAGPKVELGVFVPGDAACFSCTRESFAVADGYRDAAVLGQIADALHPVIAPTAAIAAQHAALEAIYLLTGLGTRMAGTIVRHNLLRLEDFGIHHGVSEGDCRRCGVAGILPAPTWRDGSSQGAAAA